MSTIAVFRVSPVNPSDRATVRRALNDGMMERAGADRRTADSVDLACLGAGRYSYPAKVVAFRVLAYKPIQPVVRFAIFQNWLCVFGNRHARDSAVDIQTDQYLEWRASEPDRFNNRRDFEGISDDFSGTVDLRNLWITRERTGVDCAGNYGFEVLVGNPVRRRFCARW